MTLPRQRGSSMGMMRPMMPRMPMMEGNMARPNANAPLGQGGRFAAVEAAAARSGARNPAAVAAAAGRKKYGKAKMAKMAAAGRRRKSRSKGPKTTTAYNGNGGFRDY